jgi:hypothetical protein
LVVYENPAPLPSASGVSGIALVSWTPFSSTGEYF